MRLFVLLPQLIWPEPEDRTALAQLASPSLEWLLARGSFGRRATRDYEQTLASLFGHGSDAPFGPLRLLGEAATCPDVEARDGFWLCADPVHLRFHHERIILADAGAFDLAVDEALALASGLNQAFSDIGIFHVADTRRWYVRLHAGTPFSAPPLSAVAGRRIEGELPAESHASKLRSWLNEVQMFLHSHPINAARANAGKPAVNSLWLWGGGTLPSSGAPGYDCVWATDPLAIGLARACGIPSRPLPERLDGLLAHAASDGTHLVVLDDLLPPVLYEDSLAWHDAVIRLEKNWFEPIRYALGRQLGTVTLLAPTVYGELAWEIKGADRWKIWRRPQPLPDLAKALAQ